MFSPIPVISEASHAIIDTNTNEYLPCVKIFGGGGGGGGGRDRKWVRMPDLSLMLTLIILIMKTGCFSSIIKSLLAVFTYEKPQDM